MFYSNNLNFEYNRILSRNNNNININFSTKAKKCTIRNLFSYRIIIIVIT